MAKEEIKENISQKYNWDIIDPARSLFLFSPTSDFLIYVG